MNTYTMVAKTHAEREARNYVIRTAADVAVGHTFILDDIIWKVGDVDAEIVWCTPWLFERTNPIEVEFVDEA
jgi:hypothetical protein